MKHARCQIVLLLGMITSCGGAAPTTQPAEPQTIQTSIAGAAKNVPVAGHAGAPSSATTVPVFAAAGTSSATPSASGAAGLGSGGSGGLASTTLPAGSAAPTVTATAGTVAPAVTATAGGVAAGAGGQAASAGALAAAAGAGATKPGNCPVGEMCQVSTIGNFKFCAPMTQSLPPNCTAANSSCGSDLKGTCFDAAAVGFAGMLYCLYLTCM